MIINYNIDNNDSKVYIYEIYCIKNIIIFLFVYINFVIFFYLYLFIN